MQHIQADTIEDVTLAFWFVRCITIELLRNYMPRAHALLEITPVPSFYLFVPTMPQTPEDFIL